MDDGDYTEITLGVSFKNMKSLDNLKNKLKKINEDIKLQYISS